jgi:hypothetical protein
VSEPTGDDRFFIEARLWDMLAAAKVPCTWETTQALIAISQGVLQYPEIARALMALPLAESERLAKAKGLSHLA